jgi:hypothetical protein
MKILGIAGSIASISSWVIAIYFQWHGTSSVQRNIASVTGLVFFLATILIHARTRKKPDSLNSQPSYHTQTGKMELTKRTDSDCEVFYPRPFANTPNLTLRASKGSVEMRILEQRPDGFRFRTGSLSYSVGVGLWVEWEARGIL